MIQRPAETLMTRKEVIRALLRERCKTCGYSLDDRGNCQFDFRKKQLDHYLVEFDDVYGSALRDRRE